MTPLPGPLTDVAPCPIALVRRADDPHADRALRAGHLSSVTRGVYAVTADWWALAPWDRYLARVHAAALRHPDAVFCLESAAALRGWPIFGEPAEVHVVTVDTVTARATGGVRSHTAHVLPHVETVGGLILTDPTVTAVAIARSRHNAVGLATAGHAMRIDPTLTRLHLHEHNESLASSRGRRHARWAIDRVSAVPETPLENVSLATVEWLGFEAPEPQVRLGDGTDRPDFWWRAARVCGEADGDLKYDGRFGDATLALRERRARDARLMSQGARAVAHWSWSDVAHPDRLRAVLISAGLRPTGPEHPAALRSLTRALATRRQ